MYIEPKTVHHILLFSQSTTPSQPLKIEIASSHPLRHTLQGSVTCTFHTAFQHPIGTPCLLAFKLSSTGSGISRSRHIKTGLPNGHPNNLAALLVSCASPRRCHHTVGSSMHMLLWLLAVSRGMCTSTFQPFNPHHHYAPQDVAVHSPNNDIHLHIKHSKTAQLGQSISIIIDKSGLDICPLAAILQYLITRGFTSGPLFIFPDGHLLSLVLRRPF